MAAPKTSLTKNGRADEIATRTDTESLPTLFSRLGDDVMDLFNSQLALFKVEIKEEASAYARGVTMIAVGAVIAVVGFALL
ncbi:MAG TPA: phage holin family protein, partial [Pyrinomonadaceae bacterium]|nr:phage holin family protein [Pyrinomonadaceae bacterium]